MREEVELGVAGDLRMGGEELGQLGIVVGHIVLIGEQRRVVRDDGGERGAEAQQLDELALGCGHFALVGSGRVGRRRRG